MQIISGKPSLGRNAQAPTQGTRRAPGLRWRRVALATALAFPLAGLSPAWAQTASPDSSQTRLETKSAFVADLIGRMTLDEKIGQLRLISIGSDMPAAKLADEIAAGRIGASFNTVTRKDNRPLQAAAVERSRLKIPVLFAYDIVHGHRTVFPISLGLASTWDMQAVELAARTAAVEAAADGIDMTFAPMVDILSLIHI